MAGFGVDVAVAGRDGVEDSVVDSRLEVYKSPTESTASRWTSTAEVTVFEPPDGGRQAWTVVFASSLALFSSFGVVNSYVSRLGLSVCRLW